ncbi:MAG TPA: hypothetical protein VGG74_11835 [Kofleriaceae bacterium]
MPRRFQTQTERDLEGMAHRRDRDAAPLDVDFDEDVTAKFKLQGPKALAEARDERPEDERIAILERKNDKLRDHILEIYRVREERFYRTVLKIIAAIATAVGIWFAGRGSR